MWITTLKDRIQYNKTELCPIGFKITPNQNVYFEMGANILTGKKLRVWQQDMGAGGFQSDPFMYRHCEKRLYSTWAT